MILETIGSILIFLGSIFVLMASIGLVRLPDLYSRMHATAKAGSVGVLFILMGVALASASLSIAVKALLVFALVAITAPLSTHLIARAAHKRGLEPDLKVDHLRDHEASRSKD